MGPDCRGVADVQDIKYESACVIIRMRESGSGAADLGDDCRLDTVYYYKMNILDGVQCRTKSWSVPQ